MANNDPSEWRLIDTDLVTVLGILPASESHLYLALNEPGAGELKIPLESALANSVENGMFAQCSYRGQVRGGFFVENTSKGEADAAEGGGKWLSLSGRGALALLDDGIVYPNSSGAKTRDFTGMSRAAILIALIDEAQARGALLNLSYDFSALLDSDGQSWSDNNTPALIVGTKMLEIVRSFSKVGIDFNIVPDVGGFVLSAYKLGLGSDKSETVYFRTGLSCEEITSDERGDKINNALLVEYKGGFINVDDAISILARRRREELLDLKMAQTSASATTIGAAEIELKKNPKKGISLKVYDGVGPRVFVDYGLGDYIILDVNGVETRYRIFGVQPNWVNNKFASLILELNSILYENDIQMAQDVAWLMDQMAVANDAGLLAVSYWAAIGGSDNPATSVKCSVQVGTNLYFGGTFDGLGGTVSANIIGYSLVTGQWFALGAGLPTNTSINSICEHDGAIIAAGLGLDVWSWDGSAWTSIGTMSGFDSFIPSESTPFAKTLVSFDGDLYLGGSNINSIDEATGDPGDPNHGNLAKMSGGVWEWVGTGSSFTWYNCGLVWNGEIFLGGGTQVDEFMYAFIVSYVGTGSSFTGWLTSVAFEVLCIHVANNTLYAGGSFVLSGLWVSNGTPGLSNWSRLDEVTGTIYGISSFLTDVYMVGNFTSPGSRVVKYSGGTFQQLTTGLNSYGYTITLVDDDVYVGGVFLSAGDKSADMVAAYFSNFESLMNYLENSSSDFDMGGAIHAAPASAVTDSDEFPFWEDVANALRKITWANIKATLKTYFDTLYVAWTVLTDSKDPTGWVDPSAITVTYDSAARTITLTGTLQYYWRGVKTTLTSPWTSSAHTATNGGWFLSSTDGINFTWSTTVWTFDALMVAFVNYGTTYKFAMREVHGLMQWQTHEELHTTIGTYKESGGTLSGYILASTTAANRRPDVAATVLHDEDNETINAALTSKLYNKLYLAGSTPTITYTGETADIVPLLVNNPYYNAYAAPNWIQTLMANNSYMCVWLVAIPTTADVTSQTYRYTWIQGQSNTNLAGQTALTPSDLNLGAFTTEATEFVFLAKVIIRYTGGNWDLNSVTILTGNRMIQVGSPAGAYLSSVATDATLTGDGSLASPLSVVGGGGGVSPVDPSVIGNIVSFADIAGGQADSGIPVAQVLTGTGWPFNFYRLLYTDAVGNVTDDDRLVYDPTSGIFAFGKNDGSNNSNVMFGGNTGNAATPNTTPSFWRLINYGVTSTSTNLFKGTSARGSKATPTASLIDDLLAHFNGAGYPGTGNVEDATSTGGMSVVANENQSATNRGTRLDFYSTPNAATAKVKAFTVNADGTVNIQSGKTYNINGNPHAHTAAQVGAAPSDGWNIDTNTWTFKNRTQAFTNDPAAGDAIVLNMTNTADFVVGSDITVTSSAGSENTWVTAVVANTSITCNQLLLNHTTTSRLVTLLDSFTINADVTSVIKKGTFLKFTQTTVKYGTVYSSVNSGGTTTIVMIHNSDYALANAAISTPYYSNTLWPAGWPVWFNYDPEPQGWSVVPVTNTQYKYVAKGGGLMDVSIVQGSDGGTSNATSLVLSAPVIALNQAGGANITAVDNSAQLTGASKTLSLALTTNTKHITSRSNMATGAWTAAGAKRVVYMMVNLEF